MDKHFNKFSRFTLENGTLSNSYDKCDMCRAIDPQTNVGIVYRSKVKHDNFMGKKFAYPRAVGLCEDCFNYLRALIGD